MVVRGCDVVPGDILTFPGYVSQYFMRVSQYTYPMCWWTRIIIITINNKHNTNKSTIYKHNEAPHANVASISVTLSVASCASIPLKDACVEKRHKHILKTSHNGQHVRQSSGCVV